MPASRSPTPTSASAASRPTSSGASNGSSSSLTARPSTADLAYSSATAKRTSYSATPGSTCCASPAPTSSTNRRWCSSGSSAPSSAAPPPDTRPGRWRGTPLLEDLGGAVPSGQVDLVRAGPVGLLVEVHEEVGVELIGPVGLAVELDQPAFDPGIELVVPGREQGVRDVDPITVERVLDHLRPAIQCSAR